MISSFSKHRLSFILLITSLIVLPAIGQETTGRIVGSAATADGSLLPGVTVTATHRDTGLQRVVVTDERGEFVIPALPVGRYSVFASLSGFADVTRDVRVGLGSATTVNVAMSVGGVEETITVTAESPLVDTTSTVTGLTVQLEELSERIPVGREVTQVALLAPGTTTGDNAFENVQGDQGRTPGQNLASIGGASVAENSYQVNGLNITNFRNGLGSSLVPFEFVEEVQVKTGGYEAEFGRSTGGVINMVTKAGGNRFTGQVSTYFAPESLQEQSPDVYFSLNSEETRDTLEANVSLGGPIWRDRIFFFGLYQHRDNENFLVETLTATRAVNENPFWGARLDFDITSTQHLEGTWFSDETEVQLTNYEFDPVTRTRGAVFGEGTNFRGGNNYIAKYTGIFGQNFVLSAQGGVNEFNRTSGSTGDQCPYAYDSFDGGLTQIGCWVVDLPGEAFDERNAYRLDVDWLAGRHNLRAGVDYEKNLAEDLSFYSGHEYFRYFLSGPSRFPELPEGTAVVRYRIYENGGEFDTITNAFYVQDRWEVLGNLSLNLGLRLEQYNNKNAVGESFIKVDNQYAPRLGFVWDPRDDAKSKIFGNYGRYHLPIAANTNIRLAGGELFTEDWYVLPSGQFDRQTGRPVGSLGQLLESHIFSDGTVKDARSVRQEGIEPMYQDELILGYETMIGNRMAFGIKGIGRRFGQIIEDFTLDAALHDKYGVEVEHFYVLGNPGSDYEGFFDLDGDGTLDPISFTAEELGYPEAKRNYYAVELTFDRLWANNWMFHGSYTWSHTYGNYEGYVRSDNGQDDAGITTLYDFAGLLDGAYGDLPNDRRHNVKLFGAYQLPVGIQVGTSAWYRAGRPINAFGVHPTDTHAAGYGAESFYHQGELVPRGSRGRTEGVWAIDLTGKYDLALGPGQLAFRVDVFNITDEAGVTEIEELADTESGEDNVLSPNEYGILQGYRAPEYYQAPRSVRFGISYRF